jgi:site-specific recombinase XerD
MEPELPSLPDHVTTRKGVYQYVRRVPLDIVGQVGRTHIQLSLKTRDIRAAKTAAAKAHLQVEGVFERYRAQKGLTEPAISTADWEAADWQLLAEWVQADILEQDWQKRLMRLTGDQASRGQVVGRIDEADEDALVEVMLKIRDMLPVAYAEFRWAFVRDRVASLGVRLERLSPHFLPFMAACLRLEVIAMQAIFKRQMQEPMRDVAPHPGEILRKLRASGRLPAPSTMPRPTISSEVSLAREPVASAASADGTEIKTLMECVEKWKEQRRTSGKKLTDKNQKDKEHAAAKFARMIGVDTVNAVTRRHLHQYRDLLTSAGKARATVNKEVSHVSALIKAAVDAGWIHVGNTEGIYASGKKNMRTSFTREDLERIVSQPIFTMGQLDPQKKALGSLQYWIPLLYLYAGMISKEIMQLRPHDIRPHPEFPKILVFEVTEDGGGSTKTENRKRFVPVHRKLVEFGLLELQGEALHVGREMLWPQIPSPEAADRFSNKFSAWFSLFLRTKVKITDELKTLYSLRHTFQDRLQAAGAAPWEAKQLMGHAESGMTRVYGEKIEARKSDIRKLNRILQRAKFYVDDLVKPL